MFRQRHRVDWTRKDMYIDIRNFIAYHRYHLQGCLYKIDYHFPKPVAFVRNLQDWLSFSSVALDCESVALYKIAYIFCNHDIYNHRIYPSVNNMRRNQGQSNKCKKGNIIITEMYRFVIFWFLMSSGFHFTVASDSMETQNRCQGFSNKWDRVLLSMYHVTKCFGSSPREYFRILGIL